MAMQRAGHWAARAECYGNDWLRSPIRDRIARWLGDRLGSATLVADVGSGTGHNTAVLSAHSRVPFVQVDGSLAMLRHSVASTPRCQAGCEELPLRDSSVDAVVLSLVLHHLPDRSQHAALAESWRVIRPGGRLLLVDQVRPRGISASTYQNLVMRTFYGYLDSDEAADRFDLDAENPRDPQELAILVEESGFRIHETTDLDPVVWAAYATLAERR